MVPEVIDDVEKYIAQTPNFSKEKFAEVSGISYRTLYRFLLGEQISNKSLIAILKTVHGGNHVEVLKELAERYPGNKSLQEAADNYKNLRLSFDVDPELIEFFCRDALTYRIYLLLTYDQGISREIVRDEMGKMGLVLFDELLNKNKLLEVKPGCYRLANNRQAFGEGEVLQTACSRLFALFDPDTYTTPLSQIGHMSGWISEEGFTESKELLMTTGARLIDILRKHPGSIPFSVATGMIRIVNDINFDKNSEGLS